MRAAESARVSREARLDDCTVIDRHTMATLMLEGRAGVRHIQEILGHAQLTTTERYTPVAITQLKAVHARTHPARLTRRSDTSSSSS